MCDTKAITDPINNLGNSVSQTLGTSSSQSGTLGGVDPGIGGTEGGINIGNTIGTLGTIGANAAALTGDPYAIAAAANADANLISRATGGSGLALKDAGMSQEGAQDVGLATNLAFAGDQAYSYFNSPTVPDTGGTQTFSYSPSDVTTMPISDTPTVPSYGFDTPTNYSTIGDNTSTQVGLDGSSLPTQPAPVFQYDQGNPWSQYTGPDANTFGGASAQTADQVNELGASVSQPPQGGTAGGKQGMNWAQWTSLGLSGALTANALFGGKQPGQNAPNPDPNGTGTAAGAAATDLINKFNNGQISVTQQNAIAQYGQQAKAAIRAQYAAQGLSGSSMEAQALAGVGQQQAQMVQQSLNNMITQAQSLNGIASPYISAQTQLTLQQNQQMSQATQSFLNLMMQYGTMTK